MSLPTYNIVADIRFKTDQTTTLQKLVATNGFRTLPGDTPANTHVLPRLKTVGTYSMEMFSSARMTGPVKPSVGEISIINDDGVLDDWIYYGTAGGEVSIYIGDLGQPFPSGYTLVLVAQLFNVLADFNEIRLRLRDRSYLLDKPVVTDTFKGTGDLEGPTGFSTKKPISILDPGYVPAILLDTQKQIYFVQANTTRVDIADTVENPLYGQVYEGGTRITRGPNYADLGELQYTEPAEGTVRFYWGPIVSGYAQGPIYFRLKAPPVFDIRVSAYGMVMDTADSVVYDQPHYWSMTSMCRRAGLTDVTPSSMASWANSDVYIPAQYIADDRTYLDVLQSAVFSNQAFFGFDRLNQFFCKAIGVPSDLGAITAVATFTLDQESNVRRGFLSDMEGPVWQVTVNAGEVWPSNLTNGATNEMREALSRTPWQSSISGTSDQLKFKYVNAVQATLETKAKVEFSSVVGLYFSLYGAHRDVITFEVPLNTTNLALNLNDVVMLLMPRFDCSGGRKFRVCAIAIDLSSRLITLKVWGGPAFNSSWAYGGGVTYNGGYGGGIGTGSGTTAVDAVASGKTLTVLGSLFPGSTANITGKVISPVTVSLIKGTATGDGSGSGGGGPAVHAIPVTAAAMRPQVVNGCTAVQTIASGSSVDLSYLAFDGTVATYAQFGIPMPSSWNEGTITAKFHWSHGTASTPYAVQWAIAAVAVSDNDTIATTFGTPQVIVDTGGTADKMYTSSATPSITVAGSPADGDYVFFQVYRDPTVAGDTLTVPARLHAITLFATIGSPDV